MKKNKKIITDPKKNQCYTVEISDINNLGYGVCRVQGVVVFVAGGVGGDKLRIKIIKRAADYAVARIEEIIKPSPDREQSPCPSFPKCGGCTYRHITYDYEKQLKRSYVENAFRKAGVNIEVAKVTSNNVTEGYRNKVQYPVGQYGEIGYYKAHSHEIVECDSCLLESDETKEITDFISSTIKLHGKGSLRHIYIRLARKTGEVMLCLVAEKENDPILHALAKECYQRFDNIKCLAENINPDDTNVILGKKTNILYGNDYIEDILLDCRFRIAPLSFYQVNRDMTEMLYEKVIELADVKAGEKVIDLYCGAGTIGLCLASRCPNISLLGIEIIEDAVISAKKNAELNGIKNARFVCADATSGEIENADCIIVDPPRKGLTPDLIQRLCKVEPKRIVYVSCNPDTLARDTAIFAQYGYSADTAYPFDLFPRTGHVENILCLTKQPKG